MRPYIIINVAMALNGKISSASGRCKISSDNDLQRVMDIRRRVDAVLIGANTVINDNPELNNSRCRIVLDGNLKLSGNYHVFDGRIKTIIVSKYNKKIDNASTLFVKNTSIEYILDELYNYGIKSILVEGGSNVINQFIDKKLFDEFYIYINPGMVLNGTDLFNLKKRKIIFEIMSVDMGILLNVKGILD
ncbi:MULTISPECIES: dihydrofolate reductase family protein [Acidiplasma]|uniref:Bacterial bifunctional deaminase-reductase C-terminal domain-containing protein n=2 Tax=Acidiplasma TaxID=507753 RepID=A0A0Q0VSD8_9ARCH|nr:MULTISPECIES: dihydrofolate reductase family protein [Acidiplasma]KPV46844.1 hypothetical protein SE19_03670 [Acidiplasma aeolicum]KQB34291.1 hypothetical protein AOG55_01105 [Acidiplasma cupricumulans]KQB34729.1 hypothetical protein AOG54_03680 [Acidiplasma aeolicum]